MIIEGLSKHQAIKMGNGYVVCLDYGTYHINDVEVKNLKQTFVEDLSCVKRVIKHTPTLLHYKDSSDNILSIEEVHDTRNCVDHYYNDDIEEYQFPSLEIEFELKKKIEAIKDFKPVYEQKEDTIEPIEFDVIGTAEDTGSVFIQTPYRIGKSSFDGLNGIYMIADILAVCMDEWNSLKSKFPDDMFQNASHSGLRYAQVNSHYIFNDNITAVSDKGFRKRIFTDLEEAKNCETELRILVRKHVNPFLKCNRNIGQFERSDLVKELLSLQTKLNSVDTKQKTVSDYKFCKSTLQHIINKVSSVGND